MDAFVDERDYKLLEQDKYTFFVVSRVLNYPCQLILTDHKRIIFCFSNSPFPLWIWTSDDASPAEMERAYQLAKENGFLDGNHTINMKYELADFFIKKSQSESASNPDIKKVSIIKNMFSYDNPMPKLPSTASTIDGSIYKCRMQDIEEVLEITKAFYIEAGIQMESQDQAFKKAEAGIKEGQYFFWKNSEGKNIAMCNYRPNGELASLSAVYTRPEYRRHHYAENLVYQVTKIAEQAGYLPMLYTDADYLASNACYEKIGYVLRGKLCTIGTGMQEE